MGISNGLQGLDEHGVLIKALLQVTLFSIVYWFYEKLSQIRTNYCVKLIKNAWYKLLFSCQE